MALPQLADVEKRNLRTMADNERLTVTTELQNAFIAQVNSLCGRNLLSARLFEGGGSGRRPSAFRGDLRWAGERDAAGGSG